LVTPAFCAVILCNGQRYFADFPRNWRLLAVSATNGCNYCINSHTAAVQKLGLDNEGLGEVLAVVGLYNQMNKLADAYQVEPDILPKPQ
jgi:AhpD family alkylhydroperoxidase